jgi:hypothetical protein
MMHLHYNSTLCVVWQGQFSEYRSFKTKFSLKFSSFEELVSLYVGVISKLSVAVSKNYFQECLPKINLFDIFIGPYYNKPNPTESNSSIQSLQPLTHQETQKHGKWKIDLAKMLLPTFNIGIADL